MIGPFVWFVVAANMDHKIVAANMHNEEVVAANVHNEEVVAANVYNEVVAASMHIGFVAASIREDGTAPQPDGREVTKAHVAELLPTELDSKCGHESSLKSSANTSYDQNRAQGAAVVARIM